MSAIRKARCESQTSTLSDLTPVQLISWRRLLRCPATTGGNERTPAVHFLSRIAVALEPITCNFQANRMQIQITLQHADWLSEYLIHFLVSKTDRYLIWKNRYFDIDILTKYSFIILCYIFHCLLYIFYLFLQYSVFHVFRYIFLVTNLKQLHLSTHVSFFRFYDICFSFLIHTCILIVDRIDGKTVNSTTARSKTRGSSRAFPCPRHYRVTHQADDIICGFGHSPNNNTKQWRG